MSEERAPYERYTRANGDTVETWTVTWGRPFPQTRWQRFKLRWRVRGYRVRDAWLVLTGKADVE